MVANFPKRFCLGRVRSYNAGATLFSVVDSWSPYLHSHTYGFQLVDMAASEGCYCRVDMLYYIYIYDISK